MLAFIVLNLLLIAGGQIVNPRSPRQIVRSLIVPQYPYYCIKNGYEGTMQLALSVAKDGSVQDVELKKYALTKANPPRDALDLLTQEECFKMWFFSPLADSEKVIVNLSYKIRDSNGYCPPDPDFQISLNPEISVDVIGYRAVANSSDEILSRYTKENSGRVKDPRKLSPPPAGIAVASLVLPSFGRGSVFHGEEGKYSGTFFIGSDGKIQKIDSPYLNTKQESKVQKERLMQWRFPQTDDSTVRKHEFVIDYSVVDSDMYCAPPPIYILRFGDPLEILVTGFQPRFSR